MKKLFRIGGIVLLVLILIIAGGFFYINARGIPSYPIETETHGQLETHGRASLTAETVARGKKLASMLCVNCHRNPETGTLSGTRMKDLPAEFGTVYTRNITQDKEHGIGDWTDGDLIRLLRTGIGRDGKYLPIYMPKFPNMADSDIDAVIAFLRSDDPLVQADNHPDKDSEPSFLVKLLSNVVWKPLPMPEGQIAVPDTSNEIAFGRYLAVNLDCYACHSADFTSLNMLEPEKSEGYFAGGNKPLDMEGRVMLTPNLTPDKETGIGSWTKEQFIQTLRTGIKTGQQGMRYPMMAYSMLSEQEAGAIYEYLQTVPAIENKVERLYYD